MEGRDVPTVLDWDQRSGLHLGHWPEFVRPGVVSLGTSCSPTHCTYV